MNMAIQTPKYQEFPKTSHQQYAIDLSTTQMKQPVGSAILAAFGSTKDYLIELYRQSLKAKLPILAPPDALTEIGKERGLPQGVSESSAAYASRLQDAWNSWPWAGTAFGLLRAFYSTGYTNVVLAQVGGGKVFTLDNGITNSFLWSSDLSNPAWTKRGTCVVTKNVAVAPDGTTTAAQVTGLGAVTVNDFFQTVSGPLFFSGTSYNPSFYIKRISASGTLTAANPSDNSINMSINLATIGAGWVRIDPGAPVAGVTVAKPFVISTGNSGLQFYATAGGPLSFNIWIPQNEIGATSAGVVTATFATAKPSALAAGSLLISAEPNGIWETDQLSTIVAPLKQSFWSKFDVLFPLPLMPPNFGWAGGIPGSSSAEANFIRSLIAAWKPAHVTCNRIVIVQQGSVWGYPATGTWGEAGDTWGGDTTTVWTP